MSKLSSINWRCTMTANQEKRLKSLMHHLYVVTNEQANAGYSFMTNDIDDFISHCHDWLNHVAYEWTEEQEDKIEKVQKQLRQLQQEIQDGIERPFDKGLEI